jgi:hypothetical protein
MSIVKDYLQKFRPWMIRCVMIVKLNFKYTISFGIQTILAGNPGEDVCLYGVTG